MNYSLEINSFALIVKITEIYFRNKDKYSFSKFFFIYNEISFLSCCIRDNH